MDDLPDILVYGGVFDPVHIGHQAVVEAVRAQFPDTRLMVEVTVAPPHGKTPVAPAARRIEWVTRTITGVDILNPVTQGSPQYMVDTVRQVAGMSPAIDRVGVVIGDDQWKSLASWRDFPALCELAIFVAVSRDGTSFDPGLHPEAAVTRVQMDPVDASSSRIRDACAVGDRDTVAQMVDPRIVEQVFATYR